MAAMCFEIFAGTAIKLKIGSARGLEAHVEVILANGTFQIGNRLIVAGLYYCSMRVLSFD